MSARPNSIPLALRCPFPVTNPGYLSVANTGLSGSGAIEQLVDGGEHGGRVDFVSCIAMGTTTAGFLRFWLGELVGTGLRWMLVGQIQVAAATPSASVAAWEGVWEPPGGYLDLWPNQRFGASTYNAEAFSVHVNGGQY